MQITKKFLLLVIVQLTFLSGCTSTVPATVTLRPGSPLDPKPMIYLNAPVQWERIAQSLRDAGMTPTDNFNEANYALDVQVGKSRALQQPRDGDQRPRADGRLHAERL
jgi:hypothetical protein